MSNVSVGFTPNDLHHLIEMIDLDHSRDGATKRLELRRVLQEALDKAYQPADVTMSDFDEACEPWAAEMHAWVALRVPKLEPICRFCGSESFSHHEFGLWRMSNIDRVADTDAGDDIWRVRASSVADDGWVELVACRSCDALFQVDRLNTIYL